MKVNIMDSIICVFNKKEVVVKINDKFERLTVLNIFKQDGKWCAKCRCDCGKIIDKIIIRSLLSGNTKSCGCLNKDLTIERNFKHGFKTRSNRTRLYNIWVDMRRR